VLADFANTTGDPVFDGTLQQGLSVQLEQSPFLNVLSDRRVLTAMKLMGQPAGAKLTPELARQICLREGSKAVLESSIGSLGSQYVLGLRAVNCRTGDTLAEVQVTANGKEQVLGALGKATTGLRSKLGESLATVEKYDVPLEQVTTPSLEALQAFTLARRALFEKGDPAAIPLYKRAIELDPNFARAYASLGLSYSNLGETALAAKNLKKAFELRERVSERERFYISAGYYSVGTNQVEKAIQTYELWIQTYPRDVPAHTNLGDAYLHVGQFEKTAAESREAIRLDPNISVAYDNLMQASLALNRLDEARASYDQAQAHKFDPPILHSLAYELGFLQNDTTAMAKQAAWATGKPGAEDVLLAYQADTAAYSGQLGKARELSRRAVSSAQRADQKETAADWEAEAALREALFGNVVKARNDAEAALALSRGRDVQAMVALALAVAGDAARAQVLADDLAKGFPEDTIVSFNYLPAIRGQIELDRGTSAKAIELLQAAAAYELGQPPAVLLFNMYPVYVRGQAYLGAHQGGAAAAEFQKILDHRGIVLNEPIGALAHLGLGRAYALQGDSAKARTAYLEFLNFWKDADPDIPILREAKAEYAKLK
jgi:eukaryotic-like serine/threonine-protein kinase